MYKSWRIGLLVLFLMGTTACGGGAATSQACGGDVCVTGITTARVDSANFLLVFQLTDRNGEVDTNNLPRFVDGLTIAIDNRDVVAQQNDTNVHAFGPAAFSAADFQCNSGESVPSLEGQTVAACWVTINIASLNAPLSPGSSAYVSFYSDTFPIVNMNVTIP